MRKNGGTVTMKEKILRMIKYAYTNVPLYEKKNIDITSIKDIKDVPVIRKEEIMVDWEEGISSNYLMKYLQGKLMSSWTSGSTGKCLRVLWTKEQYNQSLLPLWILRHRFYDIKPTDKFCYFYNTPNVEHRKKGNVFYEIIENSMGFYKNNLSEEVICNIIDMIKEYSPRWLMLQPSTAVLIGRTMEKLEISLSSVEYIELSGEMLFEETRNYLKKIFGCTIANQYGCNELNSIAYECPEGNLHCLESNVYVEVVKKEKRIENKEEGELCLTTLNNETMPLVRYAIGDSGLLRYHHSCDCGLKSPILELTSGRISTYIQHEDGTLLSPYIFIHAVHSIIEMLGDVIIQFRVIQKEYQKFEVIFVISDEVYENLEEISAHIEEIFLNSIDEKRLKNSKYIFLYTNHVFADDKTGKCTYFEMMV